MPTLNQKISFLKKYLNIKVSPYTDEIKSDICFFIGEFEESNPILKFLEKLDSLDAIEYWVDTLVSLIVLKFDEEYEKIDDFIYDQMCYTLKSDSSIWNRKENSLRI